MVRPVHVRSYTRRRKMLKISALPLETYRQRVLKEFKQVKPALLQKLKSDYPEIKDIHLIGSVLNKNRFREASDIDVAVDFRLGTPTARIVEIYYGLRGTISLGGAGVDIVPTMGGEFISEPDETFDPEELPLWIRMEQELEEGEGHEEED